MLKWRQVLEFRESSKLRPKHNPEPRYDKIKDTKAQVANGKDENYRIKQNYRIKKHTQWENTLKYPNSELTIKQTHQSVDIVLYSHA